jgi:hypothetical protein
MNLAVRPVPARECPMSFVKHSPVVHKEESDHQDKAQRFLTLTDCVLSCIDRGLRTGGTLNQNEPFPYENF